MVRLLLFIIVILFLVWIIRPFFITKEIDKNIDTVDKTLDSNQSTLMQREIILITITAVTLLGLIVWILPKFGINFFSLLQKIVPIISSLRGYLPF